MYLEEARAKIESALSEAIVQFKDKGLITVGKIYFCDKNLIQTTEFTKDSIIIMASISVGLPDMEDDEYCTYGLSCEIKTALVNDEELENEIKAFKEGAHALFEEIFEDGTSVKEKLIAISERQEQAAEQSFNEFNNEMRKMKLKLYAAIGVLSVIAVAILFSALLF